jgi:tetratricopeptide (TPR) repeat protein
MNNPPRTIRRDTRFFISAVTRELGSIRKLVKKALEDNDNHAVEQDNFPPDYRDLIDKLRERIASCDAVIHIAGHCYGAEPNQRPPDAARRSYTQLEYEIAVELGKPVYVFLTGDNFPTDPHDSEPPEFPELQQAHRQRLTSTGKDYNPTTSAEQLDQKIRSLRLKVERLEEELTTVDTKVAVAGRGMRRWLVLVAAVGIASLGVVGFVGWRQQVEHDKAEAARKVVTVVDTNLTSVKTNLEEVRKQFADPDVLTGKLKSHIRKRAEEEIAAAKAKTPDDWRKRDEIEKRRDQALERVEDLVETIRKGLVGEPDPIFVEAAEILDKQGVDEAIKYLEQKQPSIDKKIGEAKSSRDQAEQHLRDAYGPKVLQADLYKVSLKWDAALKIREEVARENPRWFEARTYLGLLLKELARFGEAEFHYRAAVDLAANSSEQATSLNNLAELLCFTNRLAEAEPLYRRALAIDEQSYEAEHPKVAIRLNNLAELLRTTNRLAEAEPLYRRALAIDEHSFGAEHPNVATGLLNLAGLLQDTSRLAEAETLSRRALAIFERSYGAEHPNVATNLNNLASLLETTNRLAEAEPLFRRALAIFERSYGAEHPNVATNLNNLAGLLLATNRLAEAEPLYRQALAIAERSYGPEHPDVARDLNNLALLLQATNRLAESEPLIARAVRIFLRFQRSTGYEHPYTQAVTGYYRDLLTKQKLAEPEIAARIKGASEGTDKLSPIVPEVERLLGPGKPVADVLASLDRQYKKQGKPAVYFLEPGEPIAAHLDELLRPNGDGLDALGGAAFRAGANADAVVLFEAALELMADQPTLVLTKLWSLIGRAAALRELGMIESARNELSKLLPELEKMPVANLLINGRTHYHLATCEWRLGERAAAQAAAEKSLATYDAAPKAEPVSPGTRQQTEELLVALKEGKAPPPLAAIDGKAAIEVARARYRAREALSKLGLKEASAPLLDQMLGPAKPTKEVLDALDRQYREQGKPPIWFLPLDEPIGPRLDELLGKPK